MYWFLLENRRCILLFGHFWSIIFLTSLNCVIKSLLGFPPCSPDPVFEQYMHPPYPLVPSIFGQVKPAFKLTLKNFRIKFVFKIIV